LTFFQRNFILFVAMLVLISIPLSRCTLFIQPVMLITYSTYVSNLKLLLLIKHKVQWFNFHQFRLRTWNTIWHKCCRRACNKSVEKEGPIIDKLHMYMFNIYGHLVSLLLLRFIQSCIMFYNASHGLCILIGRQHMQFH
jgi:hypothetical protein